MIGDIKIMCDNKQFRIDDNGFNESYFEHGNIIGERNAHFSIEPSNEKDYDICLMTGNNHEENSGKKGGEEK